MTNEFRTLHGGQNTYTHYGVTMPYKIEFEFAEKYMIVRAVGEQTLENNRDLAIKVHEAISNGGLQRVLVDIRGLSGQPGTASDIEYAEFIKDMIQGQPLLIALLFNKSYAEYTRFFETTLVNRGINIKIFSYETEAINWVKG